MTHKLKRVRVEEYAYCVNKFRENVGLETFVWRQIVTSQTPHTKYNVHHMPLNETLHENFLRTPLRVDNARGFSNEFPWISIWPLVKPHAVYCVDMLKARWLLPVFAESYRLLRVQQAKELVAVHVW